MHKPYRMLREAVYKYPLALTAIPNKKLVGIAEGLIPYSTGIEIECSPKSADFKHYDFNKALEDISLMDRGMGTTEIKIRLHPGVKGMIALYKSLEVIKTTHGLNMNSGIHFHIDCSDLGIGNFYFDDRFGYWLAGNMGRYSNKWILDSLMSWNYTGKYNSKDVDVYKGRWVAARDRFCTIEFRICRMSFDYSYIIKKIIHCQNIVRKIKADYKKYVEKTS